MFEKESLSYLKSLTFVEIMNLWLQTLEILWKITLYTVLILKSVYIVILSSSKMTKFSLVIIREFTSTKVRIYIYSNLNPLDLFEN